MDSWTDREIHISPKMVFAVCKISYYELNVNTNKTFRFVRIFHLNKLIRYRSDITNLSKNTGFFRYVYLSDC